MNRLDELLSSHRLPPLPRDRMNQIESAIVADLKPVRPLAPAAVYFWGFALIFGAACGIGFWIAGWHGWKALSSAQKLLIFLPLIVSSLLLAFSLVHQMVPAAPYTRLSAMLSTALFVLLLLAMTVQFHAASEPAFVHAGLVCFRTGMVFAVPTAFLLAPLLLHGAGLSPLLTGATGGGLAGLAGFTILEMHCPNLDLNHILVWHVSVTLVCVISGLTLGAIVDRLSRHAGSTRG
jgi:hypothetical protein